MKKSEFMTELRSRLSGIPEDELLGRLEFYGEMIDDRVEDGASEEEAVAAIGTVDEVVSRILMEVPLRKIAKERVRRRRRMKSWEIVLLSVGSPIWVPLTITAFCLVAVFYAVLWVLDVTLWAVFASFAASALGGTAAGVAFAVAGNAPQGIVLFGASLVLAGLAILLFFASVWATKGCGALTARIALSVKRCIIGKEKEA